MGLEDGKAEEMRDKEGEGDRAKMQVRTWLVQ